MAISFSRPDPSSPAAVADAAFGTARRGFDQQEVRDFLRMVAAELARLQERERFLERELRAAQANTLPPQGMDDDMATRLLGEEAARILQTAREGATAIRTKAEDGAGRLLREAAEEAQRVREETDLAASRRRTEAAADAEAELATAKQQGREMVEEAKAYRERVLSELSRRRELARQQIEQLLHGRDRLLQAFERARVAAVDVVAEITPLGAATDDIDLSPTTGPVPVVSVARADLGDASAIDDVALLATVEAPEERDEPETDEPDPPSDHAVIYDGRLDDDDDDATVLAFPAAPESNDEIDDDDVTATDIDDLFARLRAGRPEDADDEIDDLDDLDHVDVGDDRADPDGSDDPDVAETPFRRRDATLVPLIVASARKLKRVLADEQNEVLDVLRNKEPVTDLDGLLATSGSQADRFVEAVTGELVDAIGAGAAAVGGSAAIDTAPGGPLDTVHAQLLSELVEPLRERLARSVVDGDGDNDAVAKRARGVYREWKTQRIDEQLDDLFRVAYCQGTLAAVPSGARTTWVVDPDGPPSPDCEDNALSGPVTVGEPFPSGHVSPPMHPGCRCLLFPVDE